MEHKTESFGTPQLGGESQSHSVEATHETLSQLQDMARGSMPEQSRDGIDAGGETTQQSKAELLAAIRVRNERMLAEIPGRAETRDIDRDEPFDARTSHEERTIQETPEGAPMTDAHAGGALGERDLQFAIARNLGRDEHEVIAFSKPPEAGIEGEEAHGLTRHGPDAGFLDTRSMEIYIVDNKAAGDVRTIATCSSLTTSLESTIENLQQQVREGQPKQRTATETGEGPDTRYEQHISQRLEAAREAARDGRPMPKDVHLVVTNAGGYASGISASLEQRSIEFVDVVPDTVKQAREQDIKKARDAGRPPGRARSHGASQSARGGLRSSDNHKT
jgi:hypothetical protein